MHTWIIGSGGLFGSALARASEDLFIGPPIPWLDSQHALQVLRQTLSDFTSQSGDRWCIAWAAGQATTSSGQEQANQELDLFTKFIQQLNMHKPNGQGVFLLTSSAGGVYAGSSPAPFSSSSIPHPLGIYGQLKLAQEQASEGLLASLPVATLRVSNLYGPGQDLGKLQGLISRLALAAITRKPITVFVPLDTMREYIFTDDAAKRALHWASRALETQESTTRVVSSGQPETIGHIIALMNDITRVRIPIASGVHDSASAQARDLRLIPDADDAVQEMSLTPLPAGMKQVFLDIRRRHAAATLAT